MADFEKAMKFVLSNELDANDPDKVTKDSGGLTKYGIAAHAHPDVDIKNLTLADAKKIYRADYWTPLSLEAIEDDALGAKLLDIGVNTGISEAARLLQRALIALGAGIEEDGVIGAKTLAAANAEKGDLLVKLLCNRQEDTYRHIARARPDEAKYLDGWLVRAAKIPSFSSRRKDKAEAETT